MEKRAFLDAFPIAVSLVLSLEGEVAVRDPADPGGLTKYGIATRFHPLVDVMNLTREQAVAIYRKEYWDRYQFGLLPAAIAVAMFDGAVNQGPTRVISWMQSRLGVIVDGVLGPQTIGVLSERGAPDSLRSFLADRAFHYGLNADFHNFGMGWMQRLFRVHEECLKLL